MTTTKYIFDLDDTLYKPLITNLWTLCANENTKTEWCLDNEFYDYINHDNKLCLELESLNDHAYLFTNASKKHMNKCLNKLKCSKYFKNNTISNDDFNKSYKPNNEAYFYAIMKFKLHPSNTIYFFEDSIENLKTAKKLGWITVLIDHNNLDEYPYYIDYVFNDIIIAIQTIKKL